MASSPTEKKRQHILHNIFDKLNFTAAQKRIFWCTIHMNGPFSSLFIFTYLHKCCFGQQSSSWRTWISLTLKIVICRFEKKMWGWWRKFFFLNCFILMRHPVDSFNIFLSYSYPIHMYESPRLQFFLHRFESYSMLRKIFMKVHKEGRWIHIFIYLTWIQIIFLCCTTVFCFVMRHRERLLCGKRIKIRFIFILHVLWLSNEDQYRQLYEWIRIFFLW